MRSRLYWVNSTDGKNLDNNNYSQTHSWEQDNMGTRSRRLCKGIAKYELKSEGKILFWSHPEIDFLLIERTVKVGTEVVSTSNLVKDMYFIVLW